MHRIITLLLVFLASASTFAQKNEPGYFTGKVVDANGEPLIGASITVKGKKAVGVTDAEGTFRIDAEGKSQQTFVISYLGMASVEKVLKSGTSTTITIQDDMNELDDVVVTGYQTLSRRESASAVVTKKMEELFSPDAMNLDQMLQGKIPGMSVMLSSGEPSSTATIRIRGNSTINGNKAPVWVVDGVIMSETVPFTASDLTSPDATYLIGNSISGLSPQDIESITVLKDASATAIYGVKAANGVIVVTTKKGKESAPQITYDANFNYNTNPRYSQFDRMNSQQRVQLSKEIYDSRLEYPRVPTQESYEGALQQLLSKNITQSEFDSLVKHYETVNTDWFDLLFRPVVTQNHNVSLNGGSGKVRYYTSVSYNNSPGIAKGSSSDRFTGLSKVSVKINRIFDFDLKLDISNSVNKGYSSVSPFTYAFNTSRAIPCYGSDGELYYYNRSSLATRTLSYNVLNELDNTGQKSVTRRMGGLFNLNAHLLPGLTYRGTVSYYWNNNNITTWATDHSYAVASLRGYDYGAYERGDDSFTSSVIPYGGTYTASNTRSHSYTVRNTLNYIQEFAGKHEVNFMAGIEARSEKYDGYSKLSYGWDPQYGQSFAPVYTTSYLNRLEWGSFDPQVTDKITQVASFFGTASYTFDNRYVINANIRSDGSNKFGSNPKYRWLPTWSVAGKWIASNEKFIQNLKIFDNLSLRASYGLQGNIIDSATPNLIVQMSKYNDTTNWRPGSIYALPNPDLRWEKTKSYNIGLDVAMFNNRLTFTVDVYRKNTSDLITDMRVSPTTGRTSLYMNAGDAVNKGIEGVVSVDILRGKTFDWNMSFNFSNNTNEIRYSYVADLTEEETIQNMIAGNVAVEGQPLGTIYSYRYAGLSSENGYPLFYAKDGRLVHEGDAQALELVPCGSIYPDLTGGFDTRLTYKKNLSLTLGFSYQFGGVKRLPSIYSGVSSAFDPTQNVSTEFLNRWRKPGDEAHTDIPALYDSRIADSFPASLKALYDEGNYADVSMVTCYDYSDLRVAKSDFLRLRNVTVSYRLPRKWLDSVRLKECTIRFQASNLHVWKSSKWGGLDPETAYANMPIMPSYNLGINVGF